MKGWAYRACRGLGLSSLGQVWGVGLGRVKSLRVWKGLGMLQGVGSRESKDCFKRDV